MEIGMKKKPNNEIDRPVSLKQLAEELGFHTSSVRKVVVRRGFVPFSLSEGKNKPLFLKPEDAESFKQQIENERNNSVVAKVGISPSRISGVYFIEVPSYEGINRIKIGWSDNLSDRLSAYRTIVPDLRVKAFWQTTDAWCERAALKCAERLGKRIHQELFEFEDTDAVLSELTELFLKMGIENKHQLIDDKAQSGKGGCLARPPHTT
jgi:hypothetical protein